MRLILRDVCVWYGHKRTQLLVEDFKLISLDYAVTDVRPHD